LQAATITLLPSQAALIYFHKFTKQLPPPANTMKKSCVEELNMKSTLPCGRTATNQQQFGGQHRVLDDIGGSENGALF
jgi:hypothetical protein